MLASIRFIKLARAKHLLGGRGNLNLVLLFSNFGIRASDFILLLVRIGRAYSIGFIYLQFHHLIYLQKLKKPITLWEYYRLFCSIIE